ncbi:MAG TPA: NADPH:quinone oxidoreductase family protein [Planctomycetes bacterium]|jgi:NADPH2:quinone reductase|nr:NADPH:quinone oxidoreductase family protein [Planctomycetaceae bacterium]HIM30484.1 NADPH:quinone oxidoreductase family protein [Planctomycetota bacterium]
MNNYIQAVRCHRYAGLDENGKPLTEPEPLRNVLSLDEIPTPECGPESVLVTVNYVGVQYPDALQAQGLYQEKPPLPFVPGMDLTGTVREVGENVEGLQVGDRVIAQVSTGALAEVVRAEAPSVWKVPDNIPLSHCANIGRNFFAAYHSLKIIGEVTPGDLVLIDGASGGVGMAAIQLAKAMGAQVIAGVSIPEKREYPAAAGADRVFCYGSDRESYRSFKNDVKKASNELGHPAGVDVVLDMVQGDLFEAALVSSVRPLGKICLIGFTAGQKPIRPGMLLIKQAAAVGSLWSPWAAAHPARHEENVAEIIQFMSTGTVEPRVDRLFPLARFIEAFELFENNQGRGNTVVCVLAE